MKTKQLPRGWKERSISNFAEVITGGTPSTTKKEYWENGTIPWLPSGKCKNCEIISAEKFITKEGLENSSARMMPKETVVMALTGTTTGKIGILKIEASANQSVTGILPSEEHLPKFLFYYLRTIRNKILSQSYGGAQPHISQGFVKNLKIPFPPLQTQKKIVQILEKAEKLKQRREQSEKLTDEYLKSVFYEMFLKKEFEEVELGNKELFEIQSGGTPSRAKKEYWENGTIPWIGSTACKDLPISKSEQFITKEGLKNSSARLFLKNTVLVALVGATIGKTGILNFECATNQNIAGINIKDNEKVDTIYLFFALKNLYQKFLSLSSETFKMANLSFIRSLKIPLPPLPLQQKFANIVEKVEKLKEKQKQSKKEINLMFDALMQKAFKGELIK